MTHVLSTRQKLLDNWLVGWLVGWMAGWLANWLVGWMDGWLYHAVMYAKTIHNTPKTDISDFRTLKM
jgi:hypothetical protein